MLIKIFDKILLDLSKLESLDGTNYHRWSKKLLIFFEYLEVNYVLTTDAPSDPPVTTPASFNSESSTGSLVVAANQVKKVSTVYPEKYIKDNKTVCKHLLNPPVFIF